MKRKIKVNYSSMFPSVENTLPYACLFLKFANKFLVKVVG
jgi:hypothetical protein